MGKLHLSFEELSALFDGELSAQADTSARQHLRECPQCSTDYRLSVRLERDLRQPPVLSCDTALELLSASFDDQASQPERAVAERHLSECEACRGEVQLWGTVGYVLRTLPAGRPSRASRTRRAASAFRRSRCSRRVSRSPLRRSSP